MTRTDDKPTRRYRSLASVYLWSAATAADRTADESDLPLEVAFDRRVVSRIGNRDREIIASHFPLDHRASLSLSFSIKPSSLSLSILIPFSRMPVATDERSIDRHVHESWTLLYVQNVRINDCFHAYFKNECTRIPCVPPKRWCSSIMNVAYNRSRVTLWNFVNSITRRNCFVFDVYRSYELFAMNIHSETLVNSTSNYLKRTIAKWEFTFAKYFAHVRSVALPRQCNRDINRDVNSKMRRVSYIRESRVQQQK